MKRETGTAYKAFVDEIAQMVQQSREYAAKSVQRTANLMYWEIGRLIISRQEEYGWGKAIIEKLSADLQQKIGTGQSWSPRNLRMMRQLYEEYSVYINEANVKQTVSHLGTSNAKQVASHLGSLKQLIENVPWGQNILILQKVKDIQARLFYLLKNCQKI